MNPTIKPADHDHHGLPDLHTSGRPRGWLEAQDDLSVAQPIWGVGLEAGMASIIGPLRLGHAVAELRAEFVFLQIGHAF